MLLSLINLATINHSNDKKKIIDFLIFDNWYNTKIEMRLSFVKYGSFGINESLIITLIISVSSFIGKIMKHSSCGDRRGSGKIRW